MVAAAPVVPAKRRFDSSSALGGVEASLETLLEMVCDADADGKEYNGTQGLWLAELDVSKNGQALEITHKGPGHCRRECRTIAKACASVLDLLEEGDEDLSEVLLKAVREKQSLKTVSQRVCTTMTGICKKAKVPLWPAGKVRKDETFKPKDQEELNLEAALAAMNDFVPQDEGGHYTMMTGGDETQPEGTVDPIDILKDEV